MDQTSVKVHKHFQISFTKRRVVYTDVARGINKHRAVIMGTWNGRKWWIKLVLV